MYMRCKLSLVKSLRRRRWPSIVWDYTLFEGSYLLIPSRFNLHDMRDFFIRALVKERTTISNTRQKECHGQQHVKNTNFLQIIDLFPFDTTTETLKPTLKCQNKLEEYKLMMLQHWPWLINRFHTGLVNNSHGQFFYSHKSSALISISLKSWLIVDA